MQQFVIGLFVKNTTPCGKVLHLVKTLFFVIQYHIFVLFCNTFVVLCDILWYICDTAVVFIESSFRFFLKMCANSISRINKG